MSKLDLTPEELAQALAAHPDYRIARRLPERTHYHAPDGRRLRTGLVVDVETTGTSVTTDEVIEIGMVRFHYDPHTGMVFDIVDTYGGLEQVQTPISDESRKVHGITDEMLEGQRFDETRVAQMLEGVSLVIAHKSNFDRPMLERRFPAFERLAWGCSLTGVPWKEEGVGSQKLDYLLFQLGFFHEGHRAVSDCRALLEVLQHPLPKSGRLTLQVLLESARRPHCRIWATGLPFGNKDKVKAAGYHWDAEARLWHLDSHAERLEADLAWLHAEGFDGIAAATVQLERLDARDRFSGRPGVRETRTLGASAAVPA